MVAGQALNRGAHAQCHVEEEPRKDTGLGCFVYGIVTVNLYHLLIQKYLENATTLPLLMVAQAARVTLARGGTATRKAVQPTTVSAFHILLLSAM